MPYFLFKERVEDFIVEELLQKEPSWEWDFHYIFFEKKNLATFDVLNKLMQTFGFNRNMIGIAGLKDKQGVTRQWISISKRDVHKNAWGINKLLDFLRKLWRVVKATYDTKLLKLGVNKWNRFEITLRLPRTKEYQTIVSKVDAILKEIQENWVPNYFGEQRFWNRGRNWQTGEKLILWEIRSLKWDNNTMAEKRFKVQAFSSYIFNMYLNLRIKAWKLNMIIPWDVIVADDKKVSFWTWPEKDNTERLTVTWPVIGDDLKDAKDIALKLEQETYKKFELPKDVLRQFAKFGIFGIRRPILLYPNNFTWIWTKDKNLILRFDLWSGAYASVIVDYLEQKLWGERRSSPGNTDKSI